MASAYLSYPDQVKSSRSPALNFGNSVMGWSPTTRALTVKMRAPSSRETSSPLHVYVSAAGGLDCAASRLVITNGRDNVTRANNVQLFQIQFASFIVTSVRMFCLYAAVAAI